MRAFSVWWSDALNITPNNEVVELFMNSYIICSVLCSISFLLEMFCQTEVLLEVGH